MDQVQGENGGRGRDKIGGGIPRARNFSRNESVAADNDDIQFIPVDFSNGKTRYSGRVTRFVPPDLPEIVRAKHDKVSAPYPEAVSATKKPDFFRHIYEKKSLSKRRIAALERNLNTTTDPNRRMALRDDIEYSKNLISIHRADKRQLNDRQQEANQ